MTKTTEVVRRVESAAMKGESLETVRGKEERGEECEEKESSISLRVDANLERRY